MTARRRHSFFMSIPAIVAFFASGLFLNAQTLHQGCDASALCYLLSSIGLKLCPISIKHAQVGSIYDET